MSSSTLGRLLHRTLGKTIALKINGVKDVSGVLADPVRLENALFNLAINARDAMPEGGVLTIETIRQGQWTRPEYGVQLC